MTDPMGCGHRCYEIWGPWIAEDPDCPVHGVHARNLEEELEAALATVEALKLEAARWEAIANNEHKARMYAEDKLWALQKENKALDKGDSMVTVQVPNDLEAKVEAQLAEAKELVREAFYHVVGEPHLVNLWLQRARKLMGGGA